MTRTRFLVAALVVVILLRLFPERTSLIQEVAVAVVGLWCVVWLGSKFLARETARRRQLRQEADDAAEFREYERELADIRARHEESSPQFEADVSALLERHRDMLSRKFGSV